MFLFKIIGLLWPFLKESILGKNTLRQSMSTDKKRVLLLVVLVVSVSLNVILVQLMFKMYGTSLKKIEAAKKVTAAHSANNQVLTDLLAVELSKVTICPKFALPILAPIPAIPLKEMGAVDSEDYKTLSILEKNYIVKLHEYVQNSNKLIYTTYDIYLRQCPDGSQK